VSQHKFEIKLSGEFVSGRHFERTEVRQEFGPAPIDSDPLILRTTRLLEDWLNNWDRIAQLKHATCTQLLSTETLKTMGSHLWKLIAENEVGEGLINVAAQLPGQRLRVLISIDGDVRPEIAGLPWEFMYYPGTGQGDDFFLSTRSDLVLTRYVTAQVPAIKPVQQTLRVLFLVVLPDDRKFAMDRVRIGRLAERLPTICPLEVVTFTDKWDSERREALFSADAKPFHVIHVIGLCRGTVREPKIYFPTGESAQWIDPAPLVNLLTRSGGQPAVPRLVVLELCDDVDGDASENFERMAPSLIRAGTPAVLAMQYPLPSDTEGGFTENLYQRLTQGMAIGEAVQEIRQMYVDDPRISRLLGTPVLYLHEDSALVGKMPKDRVRRRVTKRQAPAAPAGRDARIRKRFLITIAKADISEELTDDMMAWVRDTDWSMDLDEARAAVDDRRRKRWDEPELRSLFAKLKQDLSEVAKDEEGPRGVRRTA
jgi:hypothetical protein